MKPRWIRFWFDEWLAGCVGLENDERGLYITACGLIYSADGPIPLEHLRAACRDHGNAFNRQLRRLIALGKLTINDGEITNKRAENELENARKHSANSRQNVAKRWKNNGLASEVVLANGNANQELELEEESTVVDSLPPKPPLQEKSNGPRGTRLAPDWQPTTEDIGFAQRLGLDAGAVADEFADYWHAVPGAKGLKLDWSATFRNSCRRAAEHRGSNGDARSRPGRREPPSIIAAAHQAIAAYAKKNLG